MVKRIVPKKKGLTAIRIILIGLIMFFGSAVGIISFNEDVNMRDTQSKMYEFFTGEQSEAPLWVAIPYTIGIAAGFIGILKLFKSKKDKEPGLLELDDGEFNDKVNRFKISKRE